MSPTTRGRVNVSANVPEKRSTVSANVIVVWDDGAALADKEQAIKDAARAAILRVREVHRS